MICYAVCSTPRSGGNFLDSLLRERGLGNPNEWLNPDHIAKDWNPEKLSVPKDWHQQKFYLPDLWETDILGIRMHWTHRDECPCIADFDEAFPSDEQVTWIHLFRRDLLAQANSYLTALTTGEWSKPNQPYLEDIPEWKIFLQARKFKRQNDDWRNWFWTNNITQISVAMETLVKSPELVTDRLEEVIRGEYPAFPDS